MSPQPSEMTIGEMLKGCELADRSGLTDHRWRRYAKTTAAYLARVRELQAEERLMKELTR